MFDPQQSYPISAVVQRQRDIVICAEIRFDRDQRAIERPGRFATRSTHIGERRLATLQSLLKLGARVGIRRDDDFATKGVDQHFVAVTQAFQEARDVGDGWNTFLASEQRGMRALPERLHHNRRNVVSRQRHDIRRQEPLDHQHAVRREILQAVRVFALEVAQYFPSDVGNVVGALLEALALQRLKLLLPASKDTPHGGFRIDQRGLQLVPEFLRREHAIEHHFVRAEDVSEIGTELFFDAAGGLLEFLARAVERHLDALEFGFHFVCFDRANGTTPFGRLADEPCAPHPQARRNARANEFHRGHFRT